MYVSMLCAPIDIRVNGIPIMKKCAKCNSKEVFRITSMEATLIALSEKIVNAIQFHHAQPSAH